MKCLVTLGIIASIFVLKSEATYAQMYQTEKYQRLPFGSIKPTGWLKEQMQKDMAGFVGNLDRLVPDLLNDPIYSSGRLHKKSKSKDLGNLKSGDAEGDEQYKWWNSETQSNWWDGYIRNAFLLDDQQAIKKVKLYVDKILSTQDEDGYLGIYDKELRYKQTSENGELWAQTTLYRGLQAYYEATHDPKVWNAIVRAVDNVMSSYPINHSDPFNVGKEFSGGVAHGLTFTDVLDKMYQRTQNTKYLDYAAFLYLNYSANFSCEKDAQLSYILDTTYRLQSHGVHTYEHLRPLIVAAFATGNSEIKRALDIFIERISRCTTATGGAIGDEWIGGRVADATNAGYEYCSLHELLDSYTVLLQKRGDLKTASNIERIFFNAAQGARNPHHSCIAYLKTDNSYEMMGTRNGENEPDKKQTRYKYSPTHQDVAVCCVPNAGRITPYFLQSSWMKENDTTLVAMLLCPNTVNTTIKSIPISIEEITDYPNKNHFVFKIHSAQKVSFNLKIRVPEWAKNIKTKETYRKENGFIIIEKTVDQTAQIDLEYETEVKLNEDVKNEKYFTYGALVYSKPIKAAMQKGKSYATGFEDLYYKAEEIPLYELTNHTNASFKNGIIRVNLKNSKTNKNEQVKLIPIAKTILRQTTFK